MPTLIRLFVILLVLAGIVLGAMLALTSFVDPGEKEVTVRIPARDLVPPVDSDPLGIRQPTTALEPPAAPEVPEVPPVQQQPEAAPEPGVTTLEPGAPE